MWVKNPVITLLTIATTLKPPKLAYSAAMLFQIKMQMHLMVVRSLSSMWKLSGLFWNHSSLPLSSLDMHPPGILEVMLTVNFG